MNIFGLSLKNYNKEYFYFLDTKKNIIMENGEFTKLLYAEPHFTLNNIIFVIPFQKYLIDYYDNKSFVRVDINLSVNAEIIENIKKLEKGILDNYNVENVKKVVSNLYEKIKQGRFCVHEKEKENVVFLLKISGIWEISGKIGITYKWMFSEKLYNF